MRGLDDPNVFQRLGIVTGLRKAISSRRAWYRRNPVHERGLYRSHAANAARLFALRLQARATGRRLHVIALAERLGDIVACEPVIRHVRREFPRDRIVWAARGPYLDVLRHHPDLDATIELHCVTEWIWLCRGPWFDRAWDLHIQGKCCAVCGPGRRVSKTVGDTSIDTETYYYHGSLLDAFSRSAGIAGIIDRQPLLQLPPSTAADLKTCLGLPERFAVIHASSDEAARNWNTACWNDLIDHLNRTHGLPVVEIGLTSDLGREESPGYRNLCGRCSIVETAEVLRLSALFVGIDSGPAHLANAARTPGLVLLGRYRDFPRYMPYSGLYADPEAGHVIQFDGPAAEIPATLVFERVESLLDREGSPPTEGFSRMSRMRPFSSERSHE